MPVACRGIQSRAMAPAGKRVRRRLDVLLVERGLAPSRERARALVMAGCVFSGERRLEKAGEKVPEDLALQVRGRDHPFVSRGGVKLRGALDALGVEVSGRVAADLGASTGGFTDCLLQRGALRVHAVDVGHGQLHERLRRDPRVIVHERTNARHLVRTDLGEAVDLVTADLSFIGLRKVLPAVSRLLVTGGEALLMVKPQFELGPEHVGRGGVVREEPLRRRALELVSESAVALGFEPLGAADSALPGPKGNREIFLWLRWKG